VVYANVRVGLREFYVDDAGVPRAQAAQFLANGTCIVRVIEPYLALTIGRPPAIPAGIPTGDPRIGSGSKCDAVRHSAPPSSRIREEVIAISRSRKRSTLAHSNLSALNLIGTKKRHNLRWVLPRERERAGCRKRYAAGPPMQRARSLR
jgi:hypothetical protein